MAGRLQKLTQKQSCFDKTVLLRDVSIRFNEHTKDLLLLLMDTDTFEKKLYPVAGSEDKPDMSLDLLINSAS